MTKQSNNDEIIAPFMVAEFETLTSRILSIEQTQATRVNFYIVIITAIFGGLVLLLQNQTSQASFYLFAIAASLLAFLFGIALLTEYVELAAQVVFLYRRAGRIRRWFHDKNPSVLPYLAWTPGDDTPPFKDDPGFATFAGKDSILWLGNSISGAFLIFILFISLASIAMVYFALLIAIVVLGIVWWLQDKYIAHMMNKYEKVGSEKNRIHFPRNQQTYTSPESANKFDDKTKQQNKD